MTDPETQESELSHSTPRIMRRMFLGAASLAALGAQALANPARRDWKPWSVEEFATEALPFVTKLVEDKSAAGQDRYLHALAAYAAMLGDVPVPDNLRETSPGKWIGSNGTFGPFVILHWRLAPGATIKAHAHSYGNVVTLGLTGESIVQNFEVDGTRDYDASSPFRARLTQEQILRKGDINIVNLERNYIHGFVAGPDGASGLDITTRILPKRKAPILAVGDLADPIRKTYNATWQSE